MERLFSAEDDDAPADLTVAEVVGSMDPSQAAPEGRPLVAANMVTTLDGRASIEGGSTGLGGPTDSEFLLGLRTRFDAVMIGAGTLRAEGYGPIVRDPTIREAREAEGREGSPAAVVVTRSGDLPFDCGLFTEGIGRVLIVTGGEGLPDLPETTTEVEVVGTGDEDPVPAAIRLEATDAAGARQFLWLVHHPPMLLEESSPAHLPCDAAHPVVPPALVDFVRVATHTGFGPDDAAANVTTHVPRAQLPAVCTPAFDRADAPPALVADIDFYVVLCTARAACAACLPPDSTDCGPVPTQPVAYGIYDNAWHMVAAHEGDA